MSSRKAFAPGVCIHKCVITLNGLRKCVEAVSGGRRAGRRQIFSARVEEHTKPLRRGVPWMSAPTCRLFHAKPVKNTVASGEHVGVGIKSPGTVSGVP